MTDHGVQPITETAAELESVIAALYARATGTQRTMTRVFCHKGEPVTVSYPVELPPDVRACIFWLRNRRPGQWRENRPFVDEAEEEERWRELEEASQRAERMKREYESMDARAAMTSQGTMPAGSEAQ